MHRNNFLIYEEVKYDKSLSSSSAYSIGKRIVLDYYSESELPIEQIKKDIDYINEFCGTDIALSSHLIQTESTSWESVENKDNFFKNTLVIKDKEEFTKILLKDRYHLHRFVYTLTKQVR